MNPTDDQRRTVLITGSSSGIGLCAARLLKQRGYRVFASARKAEDVERLRSEGLESVQLDLDDEPGIAVALDKVLEQTDGKLYGLFNNGAYSQIGAVEDLRTEVLRAQFQTNFFGWHELTRRVIPVMRRQGEGRIVQDSSVLGFVSLAYRGAYNSSKYALEGLSDTLRLELRGSNVFVSLLEPGPIISRFRPNALPHFQRNIDRENSVHRDRYRAVEARLKKEGPVVPFTLPPEAVVKKLIQALESPRPRARYYVTFPTYLFGYLKRVLSTSVLDRLLIKV